MQMGRAGFTLIEVMICIAILAIVMAIPMTARAEFSWLAAEADYREALRNARWQIDELQKAPFDALPPRTMRVPANGTIQLQPHLVAGSVRVLLANVPGWHDTHLQFTDRDWPGIDTASGMVHLPPSMRGRNVVIDYAYEVPCHGECHTVKNWAPYTLALDNAPVLSLEGVSLAQGERVRPLDRRTYRLERDGKTIDVPAEARGHVVVVDYLGERVHNVVSGRFLTDDTLRPVQQKTHTRLLRVEESYGDKTVHFSMDTLRVSR
jgi:prepilin-type N-terminal cleavage/methylation domain-containing protein